MILGIESSCDETAVAIIEAGQKIRANCVYSQIESHAPFHGIVPEIASRAHLEKINLLLDQALETASLKIDAIDALAVTTHPGLLGSLMMGANMAKSISLVHNLPVIAINHLEAHLYAPCLEGHTPNYPFLGLLLSGGNSAIFRVDAPGQMERLCDTMDDALGEAFDKAASLLGLGYPGGPVIEKRARQYAEQHQLKMQFLEKQSLFPRLLKNRSRDDLAFSFSGIKTAVRLASQRVHRGEPEISIDRIAFDFQNTVFELVSRTLKRMVHKTKIRRVVASGGVLANGSLRSVLDQTAEQAQFQLCYPKSKALCTDNAAMVACLGYYLQQAGQQPVGLDFNVSSRLA